MNATALTLRQVRYVNKAFWRNPASAFFTFAFPLMFLVIFTALLGSGTKPFECVGEVNECRAAVVLAARRADRAETALLQRLAAEINGRPDAPTEAEIEAMRHPVGPSFVPAALAAEWS